MNTMLRIDDDLRGASIQGRNLRGSSLGEELGEETTLLAFLRHLG